MPPRKSDKGTKPAKKSSARTRKKAPEPTYDLKVTRDELLHVRNLLSIILPPDGDKSLSESLVECSDVADDVDSTLWQKVWDICEELQIPIGEDAPDFIVAPAEPTSLIVYNVELEKE